MSHQSVYAIATTEGQVNRIVDSLTKTWFFSNDISVLLPDTETTQELPDENKIEMPGKPLKDSAAGGLLGGTLGLLAGIGALVIPGLGPLIAAGPMLAALSVSVAGATVGGITGGLRGIGLPDIKAKHYESRIAKGNILISVLAESSIDVSRAKEVFGNAGAQDISVTSNRDATPPKADQAGSCNFAMPAQYGPLRRGKYDHWRMIITSLAQSRIGPATAKLPPGGQGLCRTCGKK